MPTPQDKHAESGERAKRVAVIAVHGVGEHPPNATARAVADLLTCPDKGTANYTGFREVPIKIPVTPLQVELPPKPQPKESAFDKLPSWLRGFFEIDKSRALEYDGDDLEFEWQRDLLGGTPEDGVTLPDTDVWYDSVRLEGIRAATGQQVDVYEVYWNDLSRAAPGVLGLFGEFFQLVFHLATVGRKTLENALRATRNNQNPGGAGPVLESRLKQASQAQSRASKLLSLDIPILNLCMLALYLSALVTTIPGGALSYVSWGLISVLYVLATYRFLRPRIAIVWTYRTWLAVLCSCIGYGAALGGLGWVGYRYGELYCVWAAALAALGASIYIAELVNRNETLCCRFRPACRP